MRLRRTVPNEKELDGLYYGGKISRTKTIPELRPKSLKEKLSWGVWKNRSLSLQSRKHAEETLMMERRPLGDLSKQTSDELFRRNSDGSRLPTM
jgi:hypothetical protein